MQGKRYEVLDGTPVSTIDGMLIVMPIGIAVVHHSSNGFSTAVGDAEPIVESAGSSSGLLPRASCTAFQSTPSRMKAPQDGARPGQSSASHPGRHPRRLGGGRGRVIADSRAGGCYA